MPIDQVELEHRLTAIETHTSGISSISSTVADISRSIARIEDGGCTLGKDNAARVRRMELILAGLGITGAGGLAAFIAKNAPSIAAKIAGG